MTKPSLDLLKASATDLAGLLASNFTTSVDIVEQCLKNIEANNINGMGLRGLICTAPHDHLVKVASRLDEERRRGKVRSPLHGIPIVLKDVIVTASKLGMDTTAGSFAFVGAKADKSAVIVDRLIDGGLIILGKANLTEFCGLKMGGIAQTPGWSPVGGQSQSPFVVGGLIKGSPILDQSAPGGSSSGSAISVAAGFAPLSLGTECCGSVVTPVTRAGLYALKTAPGSLPLEGCFVLSTVFDCVGAIGKSAKDVANLTDLLYREVGSASGEAHGALGKVVEASTEGLVVGFVDPRIWMLSQAITGQSQDVTEQMNDDYETAVSAFRNSGVYTKYPVTVTKAEYCKVNAQSPFQLISFAQARDNFTKFCNNFQTGEVHSLAEIIEWNKAHADLEMPPDFANQDDLIKALNNDTSAEILAEAIPATRKLGIDTLAKVFLKYSIDIIAAPADSSMCVWAASAGYPMAVVPYGTLKYNGRPFGVCAIAKVEEESKLVRFMSAWEKVFPDRPLPTPLKTRIPVSAEALVL